MPTIVFLCSSLEPGCDGVGDYVRRLSCELIRQGNQVMAIALYDRHINDKVLEMQASDDTSIQVVRFPSIWSNKQRFILAKEWVDTFDPDWLSLQYVPFGFQNKGLPFGLSRWIGILTHGRQFHLMFHELWVGMAIESSIKLSLWGWVQKKLIYSFISFLKPAVIHTQTHLYQAYLKQLGFICAILPLFSNLEVSLEARKRIAHRKLNSDHTMHINLVVFGSIHPNAPIREFSSEVATFCSQNKILVSMTFIGRCGKEQARWVSEWESLGLEANIIGEQPPEIISNFLMNATIGVASTPIPLIEKSASVAVMREHGLPIICITGPWHPRGKIDIDSTDSSTTNYCPGNIKTCLNIEHSIRPTHSLSDVALDLANDLIAKNLNKII